jgi:hypothetical protein
MTQVIETTSVAPFPHMETVGGNFLASKYRRFLSISWGDVR